jgi:hypothetical protein
MKSLTIVAVILATAQSLLAQGPPRPLCCKRFFEVDYGKWDAILCHPMASDCLSTGGSSGVCYFDEKSHVGSWCENIKAPPPQP